ncbi:MAG: AmmeMemoRadiSam system radical SAM enzyme [Candidatus Thermoplasmatota archaeon]|jgi:pyruvate formate lyase activating enzyme|nr:AmmeMemoRadiSam system radical SAM enzyme [Candidatus Thermoplasmatota archaeon]
MMDAKHWKEEGDAVRCALCPHHCLIRKGKTGLCGVRKNISGKLTALGYGLYPAIHLDPIEKKPLNHFLPGRSILSVGSVGCNLRCLQCQNWSLSTDGPDGNEAYHVPVEAIVKGAAERGSMGVAFTYNEPTINFEFIMDAAPGIRERGGKVVLVTNGYLEAGPWDELMEMTDAANIDVKGFTEDFYRKVTGGTLAPVLRNVEASVRKGVHVELAYLIIPGMNDDTEQLEGFCKWVRGSLGPEVPLHFTRFHPDHKLLHVPATPPGTMERARDLAMEKGIDYVYLGNIHDKEGGSTRCPNCSTVVVSRDGFSSTLKGLKDGKCPKCGTAIAGVWQ